LNAEVYLKSFPSSNTSFLINRAVWPCFFIDAAQEAAGYYFTVARNNPIKSRVTDDSGVAQILVNNKDVAFDQSGHFKTAVFLGLGKNDIMVSAMDPYKNKAVKTIIIMREGPTAQPQKSIAGAGAGKFYALIIGNNAYRYLRDLETAKRDAQVINNVLKRNYGFSTKLLIDAKRNEILDAI
jgi:hypothetical protein